MWAFGNTNNRVRVKWRDQAAIQYQFILVRVMMHAEPRSVRSVKDLTTV
jgi:hypothetical protein